MRCDTVVEESQQGKEAQRRGEANANWWKARANKGKGGKGGTRASERRDGRTLAPIETHTGQATLLPC